MIEASCSFSPLESRATSGSTVANEAFILILLGRSELNIFFLAFTVSTWTRTGVKDDSGITVGVSVVGKVVKSATVVGASSLVCASVAVGGNSVVVVFLATAMTS